MRQAHQPGLSFQPLIVGAGPVGLGASLFLARQGRIPRVIEFLNAPSQQSKALAVNPRTLELLETTDVTRQMIERGLPIHGARLYRNETLVVSLSLNGIHPRYPFMLALSQATTERLLAQAAEAEGVRVERGVKLVTCRTVKNGVEAAIEPSAGAERETFQCPWLMAADGAHSDIRKQLGIDFEGSSFLDDWYLADAPLRTALAPDHAHIFLLDHGAFMFMIRVVDDIRSEDAKSPVWRIISNRSHPLRRLIQAEQSGPTVWESSFHISHRIDSTMAKDGVYFAGDAAHIHSPFGARGMNLGLEDAWVFAELVREGRLDEYDGLRRPVDQRVVRQVELLSKIVSADSSFYRFIRTYVFPMAIKMPFLRSRMIVTLSGLDHQLSTHLAMEA